MNISYKWLQRHLNVTDSAEEIARILTSIGLEVGSVEKRETIRGGLQGLVIGEVLTCDIHPNSDHLHITTVTVGGEPLQIVCGAPNVAAGQKVVVATLGTVLYSGDESFTIKKSKIRGVESFGMLCAEDEIGVGTSHDGIMVLPADTVVGTPAREYFHVEDDYVIEVDITPNRADACSHYGVARDLYAYYLAHNQAVELKKPIGNIGNVSSLSNLQPIKVTVENPVACPRYTGLTIRGVEVKESPEWLKNSLLTIGLRPINNIVDATNYVLHDLGQALHAFDADKIAGGQVIVKNVAEGTPFVTLDGVERKLSSADLMICDAEKPMCIAGVFGGLNSGVTETTKNVFLESAYFEPVYIRKTARRHGLSTDASFRYERGCDPNATLNILKRCANLILEVAGGEIVGEPVDIAATEFKPFPVTLSLDKCNRLIGKELSAETIETILQGLEIEYTRKEAEFATSLLSKEAEFSTSPEWDLAVPRYRVDVQRDCDVIEDILRIYGYNNVEISEKLNSNLSYATKPDSTALQRKLSDMLSAQGFNEILNNSLTKIAYYEGNTAYPLENCVRLKNPLSADLAVMRQSLLYGALESIQRNVNRKRENLAFYEFGNCYHYQGSEVSNFANDKPLKAYSEEMHLALALTGKKTEQSWAVAETEKSFYQLHAIVRNLLRRLGVKIAALRYEELSNDIFADGLKICAQNGLEIGFMGIVNHRLAAQFDIENPVYFADLNWKVLLKLNKQYKPVIEDLAKFPAVRRDLALLLKKEVQFADLEKTAYETERKLLKDVFLFDVYEGKNLGAGFKSYALAFILQDPDNTLKDKQIDNVMQRLQKAFETKFEAKLR